MTLRVRRTPFDKLVFRVYYSSETGEDHIPPMIWDVVGEGMQSSFDVVADVTDEGQDATGVAAVILTYADGDEWKSVEMTYRSGTALWEHSLSVSGTAVSFFVRAVDGAGNVAVSGNKGRFFEPQGFDLYLPLVLRDYVP